MTETFPCEGEQGHKRLLEFLDCQSLVNLSLATKSFHKIFNKFIEYRKRRIEQFIDWRVFINVQKCLSPSFKDKRFVNKAIEIAQKFYEARPRSIKSAKYGAFFPMTPELLDHAMFLAKDEIVLEIAGASGENAALLAFSGAERVYMNDIVPAEVETFNHLRSKLPYQVQKKIEPILGDCFDLPKLQPELRGKVGLLLCNNLVHFFNDKQQQNFFGLLKYLLRPGGRAIFTANACYGSPNNKDLYESHPNNTAWKNVQCLVQDYSQGGAPVASWYLSAVKATSQEVSLDYQQHYLWLKDHTTSFNWKEDKSAYQVLPPKEAIELERIVTTNFKTIENLVSGALRLVSSTFHLFREENFAALFKKAGFEVEQTFLIKGDGHLYLGKDPYGKASKVGIIIRAPIKL